jgi:hypothetical protein
LNRGNDQPGVDRPVGGIDVFRQRHDLVPLEGIETKHVFARECLPTLGVSRHDQDRLHAVGSRQPRAFMIRQLTLLEVIDVLAEAPDTSGIVLGVMDQRLLDEQPVDQLAPSHHQRLGRVLAPFDGPGGWRDCHLDQVGFVVRRPFIDPPPPLRERQI